MTGDRSREAAGAFFRVAGCVMTILQGIVSGRRLGLPLALALALAGADAAGQAVRAAGPPPTPGWVTRMTAEPAGVDPFVLLLSDPVQEELGMSDDQKQKARSLIPEAGRAIDVFKKTPFPPAGTPEALLAAGERLRQENYRLAAKVLTPEQYARLEKLILQMEGPVAVAHPEVARKLGLTREQTRRVRGVAYELIMADRAMHPGGSGISTEETVLARRVTARQNRDAAVARINRILTAPQKRALADLLGPPINLSRFDPDLPGPAPAPPRRRGAAPRGK